MPNFHIQRDKKRTTVSLDKTLYDLLAIKLGVTPDGLDTHKTVRVWLQDTADKNGDYHQTRFSQWLKQEVILSLVDSILSKKYWDWRIGED